ncbi:hypothetical protein [Peribacillus frigoritolerans]
MKKLNKDGYVILLLLIGVIFFWISYFSFLTKTLEWEHIFGGACSLAGGILTVVGVQMTISAQHNQESQKLLPIKIVALHKLIKLFNDFSKESMDLFNLKITQDLDETLLNLKDNQKYNISNINEVLEITRSKFKKYMDSVSEKEFEFVEIASGIDIDTYAQVVFFFGEFNEHMNSLYFDGHITIETSNNEIVKSNHWSIEELDDDDGVIPILKDLAFLNGFFNGYAKGTIEELSKNLLKYEIRGFL